MLSSFFCQRGCSQPQICHSVSLLGCIAGIASMWLVATDVTHSVVCLCVCMCVGHMDMPCKNGWIDRDAIWVGLAATAESHNAFQWAGQLQQLPLPLGGSGPPFNTWVQELTWVNPWNHVLNGGPDSPRRRGNFGGCPAHWKALGLSAVAASSTQMASRSIQPFLQGISMWPTHIQTTEKQTHEYKKRYYNEIKVKNKNTKWSLVTTN